MRHGTLLLQPSLNQHLQIYRAASCRWGNSRSPAYGTLSDYQFMRRHTSSDKRKDAARAAWGAELAGPEDVADVFVRYCKVRAVHMCCLWLTVFFLAWAVSAVCALCAMMYQGVEYGCNA
jgi:hypothetical protein